LKELKERIQIDSMMDINCNNSNEATMETLAAMCRQEEKYQTSDYLYHSQEPSCPPSGPLNETMLDIDADCRTKMAAWCYSVVDFCQFDHETVAIAMNILDRFMTTPAAEKAKADRRTYQLAAMTSLYTAVKVHEPHAMDPAMVSKISHGTYTEQDVEAMEVKLLAGVSWRVNPPTALAFVRQCLDLISEGQLDKLTRETVYDVAKIQTELAVAEYDFLPVKASVVAYCSLMNALVGVGVDETTLHNIWETLTQAVLPNMDSAQNMLTTDVQTWLYEAFVHEPAAQNIIQTCSREAATKTMANKTNIASHSPSSSPRSISASTNL
jgi:hypothetical protein